MAAESIRANKRILMDGSQMEFVVFFVGNEGQNFPSSMEEWKMGCGVAPWISSDFPIKTGKNKSA